MEVWAILLFIRQNVGSYRRKHLSSVKVLKLKAENRWKSAVRINRLPKQSWIRIFDFRAFFHFDIRLFPLTGQGAKLHEQVD